MDLFDESLIGRTELDAVSSRPLADLLRPQSLAEFIGQEKLLGEGKVLAILLSQDRLPSLILWGPPGSGKTTLARLVAKQTESAFKEFSAVTSGLADIRQVVEEAKQRQRATNRRTIVFIDEIHRFNKAQQDAFLPHVEAGTFTLIGATTENPSFSINGALLSRCRVFVLEPHRPEDLQQILARAVDYFHNQAVTLVIPDNVGKALVQAADGDARRLLTTVEVMAGLAKSRGIMRLDEALLKEALQQKHLFYDKAGEEHYNLISALHKSVRDSDPDGALYWLGRMLEAGEDPLFLARRLTRAAAEDIGLADPQALQLAAAAFTACEKIGMPECNIILAELAVYLALAPKSNAIYIAYHNVQEDVQQTSNEPVPLHLRNAPTKLMKEIGYGKDYKYAHDAPDAKVEQEHLPESLHGKKYYTPIRGWEKDGRG